MFVALEVMIDLEKEKFLRLSNIAITVNDRDDTDETRVSRPFFSTNTYTVRMLSYM